MDAAAVERIMLDVVRAVDDVDGTVRLDPSRVTLRLVGASPRTVDISTPGDWWCELETDPGFGIATVLANPDANDLSEVIALYVRIGAEYMRSGGDLSRSRLLGVPRLTVYSEGIPFVLKRSVLRNLSGRQF